MSSKITMLLSGTGILIGMFLILNNASSTASIIKELGSTYTSSVKMLQGR